MEKLTFHHELYSLPAIEEALKVFNDYGTLSHEQNMPYYEVSIEANEADSQRELSGEFMNYVLAMTAEERRAGA